MRRAKAASIVESLWLYSQYVGSSPVITLVGCTLQVSIIQPLRNGYSLKFDQTQSLRSLSAVSNCFTAKQNVTNCMDKRPLNRGRFHFHVKESSSWHVDCLTLVKWKPIHSGCTRKQKKFNYKMNGKKNVWKSRYWSINLVACVVVAPQ